ncbi:MAG: ABC-type lipoprotein release transport system permease subunit [Bacteriovoracaceae bacterium]|jgi:ABC-type lipoprotein release transport system permease subunit
MFKDFFSVLFLERSSYRFAVGVLLGFAFSIAVILSTVGIMDGFVKTLKLGLKASTGDIYFYSRDGFFEFKGESLDALETLNIDEYTKFVQSEGFVLVNEVSKGVLVKGIEPETFSRVTGISSKLSKGEVRLGIELAKFLKVRIGDQLTVAFGKGNKDLNGLPLLQRFTVVGLVDHGIYPKNMRLMYMDLAELQLILGIENEVNMVSLNIPSARKYNFSKDPDLYTTKVEDTIHQLRESLGYKYSVQAFWNEFSTLLSAVKHEKFMIGMILQLIVVISIFNIVAFIIFVNEKRSRELFLFKALGLSQAKMSSAWYKFVFLLWISSCAISIGLVYLFGIGLEHLSIFQLPGDVYKLGTLKISLELTDYLLVFASALVWLLLLSWFSMRRLRLKSVLYGLRKEFA